MKITIVTGSQRENSESLKVGKYIQSQLIQMGLVVEIFDLSVYRLPMESSFEMENSELINNLERLNLNLGESDGIVTVTPEWGGMATPFIKNFIQISKKNLAHKPNLIVSVSAGRGGAYPIADLRAFGYKNNKTVYLPDHLIIRDVKNVLNDVESKDNTDNYIRDRIKWTLKTLIEYSKVFKTLRANNMDLLFNDDYENGM